MKKAILLSAFILLCTVCHAQEKQTKYQGEIQAGYVFGTGDSKIDHAGMSMINGWRFNRYLSAGLGIGLDYYFKNGYSFVSLPVFANVKGYLPVSDKASLFASLDCGYSVSLKDESEGSEYSKNLRNNGRIRVKFDKWLVHIPFLCYLTILLISAEGAVYGGY